MAKNKVKISIKKTAEIKKTRHIPVDFSTHTRKSPTLKDRKRKEERKYKKNLARNYNY